MTSKKLKGSQVVKSIIKRFVYPKHLWKVISLQRSKKRGDRAYDDAQLKLYGQMLPSGFLHYGYFKNANVKPEDISLNMLEQAQLDYALKLADLIIDNDSPVLDIGCGMGGLVRVLQERKLNPIALSPDRNQIAYISKQYPNVKTFECKFEDMPTAGYEQKFGTLITSESLQYLKLDKALPLMDELLKPGGRWIACDYFRFGEATERSGHNWENFKERLKAAGFKITFEEDITSHIVPTIAYAHMWGSRIALPLKDYIFSKIKTKQPGIYYAMSEAIDSINVSIDLNMETVNPSTFANQKKYVLLVMERI